MVPTAYFLGRQLETANYDFAVNAGIAGTFNKSMPPGTVVNVVEDCIPEFGAEDGTKFLSVFELGLVDPDVWPYRQGKLVNDSFADATWPGLKKINQLPTATAITSNTVRGSIQGIEWIRQLALADLESMEGAAFFYACLVKRISFLQLRAVSNFVEERDKSSWNLDLALKNLNRVLWDILVSHARHD